MIGAVILLAAPSIATAAPGPAWSISVASYPTRFADGMTGGAGKPPGYLLVVTNTGGAATSGEFTIVDSLPGRLSFSTAAGATGSYGGQQTGLSCSAAERTVSCSGGQPSLKPGETAWVLVPLNVVPGTSTGVLNKAVVSGGGAPPVESKIGTMIGNGVPDFDFLPNSPGLNGAISNSDGAVATLAGSHPYQFRAGLNLPAGLAAGELFAAGGGVRDLFFDLPPGMVVEPGGVGGRCRESELVTGSCPDSAQVGSVALTISIGGGEPTAANLGLYNMVPPPGAPIEFGVELTEGAYLHLLGRLDGEHGYRLAAGINDILATYPILGAEVTLWGDPSDASHDYVRGNCINNGGACPVERTHRAFLTMPTSCGAPLTTTAEADSWLEPGVFATRSIESPPLEGCNDLAFEPSLTVQPMTSRADSPSGFEFDLHLPQRNDYEGRAVANVRDVKLVLPEGVAINPSGANGLGACSTGQMDSAECPNNAKIGTAEIDTPIRDRPLSGAVYLAEPGENPFGTLFAVYVMFDDPATGIVIKLPARLAADPVTGRLTLSLDELPQLPIEDVKLNLFQGPRSVLKTPLGCGTHTSTSELVPWSSPEGQNATPADSFRTDVAPVGGACPSSEADAPSAFTFSAGAVAPSAGAFSPFVLRIGREDGSQRLGGIEANLPAGVTARLAGVATCSDAELAIGNCPTASRVGTVSLTAGAGSSTLPLTGKAYLAGPYAGAPLSLAIVVPAVAGPFDLRTVAVRVALHLDPRSAQIHIVSDPLPTILDGIPLDIRSIELDLDRPGFIRNPTSCEPMAIDGSATTALGQVAPLSTRFQVGDCAALPFKPKFAISLSGAIGRNGHPALRAVLRSDPDGAAPASMELALPGDELLDLRHIGALCSRGLEPDRCPPASRLGTLSFQTPFLDAPLVGPVYLRAPGKRLPGLVADLRSGPLHFVLDGHTATSGGRLSVRFPSIPDIPLSKAVLSLAGGRRGIIVNSRALCSRPSTVEASFSAHSGKRRRLRVPVRLGGRC